MKKMLWVGMLLILCFNSVALAAPVIEKERVTVPLALNGKTFLLDAMIYKPEGEGPFPALVMTHGTPRLVEDRIKTTADTYYVRQAETFAQLGMAVIFVVRRGFGLSDGPYNENFQNQNGTRNYTRSGLEAAKDLSAAIRYFQEKPYVDKNRVVLLGQSTGGHSVTAAGSLNLPGVIGVINFAGGRGSSAPDVVIDEANLIDSYGTYGKTFRVPTLWFYSANDHYFGPALAQKFLGAFQAGGAKAEFINLPPYGDDGHVSFVRAKDNWYAPVLNFLKKLGVIAEERALLGRAA
jgi:dienelactone hydrolase